MAKENTRAHELFRKHSHRAKIVARSWKMKFPGHSLMELETVALAGLWKVAIKYDHLPENEFVAVASSRILGSIYDYLRQTCWLPRGATWCCSKKRITRYAASFMQVKLDSLEGALAEEGDAEMSRSGPSIDIDDLLDQKSKELAAIDAISELSERSRMVMLMVLDGVEQKDLAKDLGVSGPRVHQIVARAKSVVMARVKGRFAA